MPLILRGARQVGKTTLVKKLGADYDGFLSFNLEKKLDKDLFIENDDIAELVNALFLSRKMAYDPTKLYLIFIDEVQEYAAAINQLRYFYEEYSDLHVIATGSLLDFSLRGNTRIPVGRVEYATLHPINFHEFLVAKEHQAGIDILNMNPTPDYAIDIMMDLFHEYINVGGMPKALDAYLNGLGVSAVQRVYKSILRPMQDDIEKYAQNNTIREVLRYVIGVLPQHVGQRISFEKFGGSNYKSREVGEAFRALELARIISLLYPTSDTDLPVSPSLKKRPKLQFLDIGLMNHEVGLQLELISIKDISSTSRGSILEQAIYQELRSIIDDPRHKHMFWTRDHKGSAEVDLVIDINGIIMPVEMKSGPTGKLRSLHEYIDRCPHHYGIRMYRGKWKVDQVVTSRGKTYTLLNIPYFLGTRLMEIGEWFVENH